MVRAIGLDVHRDFCEVAIAEEGRVRSAGRIATRPEVLEIFAASLTAEDRVALEVTGNAWEIARIIEPHVARVVVVSPPRAIPGSVRPGPRPTVWTRGRWPGCCCGVA
jgi:transposase